MNEYAKSYDNACSYSQGNGFDMDSVNHPESIERLQLLISELIDITANEFTTYSSRGFNPVMKFGSDCGNVHFSVTNFINKYYPDISANLVIGKVNYKNRCLFDFNREKSERWASGDKSDILDCHTWVNIGDNIILDCTIGTYLNTRCSLLKNQHIKHKRYGGIYYRSPLEELCMPISGANHRSPRAMKNLEYKPVLVGCAALECIAPKYP
jgi:hypothetical protein